MSDILEEISKYVDGDASSSIGKICVLLFVTTAVSRQAFPYRVDPLLTENGGQIKGLGAPSILEILRRHQIEVSPAFIGEGGRTSRGAVARARAYVDFLNKIMAAVDDREEQLEDAENLICQIIGDRYERDEKSIISELPTRSVDYAGPQFHLHNDKLQLKSGRYAADRDDPRFLDGIINQLKSSVRGLVQEFSLNNNCYSGLRTSFSSYESELRKRRANINIFSICHLGFLIQAQTKALSRPNSEDPPLSAEQAALVDTFIKFHFVFLINTDEGRKILDSAQQVEQEVNSGGDLAKFKKLSNELVADAAKQGVVDQETADFIVSSTVLAGTGDTPLRSRIFGILVSRNFWSSLISNLVFESFKKSTSGQQVFNGIGIFIDVAVGFVIAHADSLIALARALPEHFFWLERFLDWFK
jgi:hypothetical protein